MELHKTGDPALFKSQLKAQSSQLGFNIKQCCDTFVSCLTFSYASNLCFNVQITGHSTLVLSALLECAL